MTKTIPSAPLWAGGFLCSGEEKGEKRHMVKIGNLDELRQMPDSVVKTAMQARAVLCHDDDEDILLEMEEEFNGPLGGDWYQFEEGDDPRNFLFDDEYLVDLLSDEWNWCDDATLQDGCYFVFWGTNNAGGPCLFVADAPWIPTELRSRLNELVESV